VSWANKLIIGTAVGEGKAGVVVIESGGCIEAVVGVTLCVTPTAGFVLEDDGTVKAACIPGEKNAETMPTSTRNPMNTHPIVIARCKFRTNKVPFLILSSQASNFGMNQIYQELPVCLVW
jgi:hypothetical protein